MFVGQPNLVGQDLLKGLASITPPVEVGGAGEHGTVGDVRGGLRQRDRQVSEFVGKLGGARGLYWASGKSLGQQSRRLCRGLLLRFSRLYSASRSSRPRCGRPSRTPESTWASDRTSTTWADFRRSQAEALLACDFFEVSTLSGTRRYVLAVIEHTSRWIRVLGTTPHPTTAWVTQVAKNLVMELDDAGIGARFLIRDRDGKFPALFDTILADAGIQTVLSGVRIPQMNSIMERWIKTCRHELLDRTLIWNQRHLLHALREYEQFYNSHRPHQGIANARPLHPLPPPITNQAQISELDVHRRQRLGGILNKYHHVA